ncbi:MAG: hypothetical protein LBJ02_00350 [Bifidobacteriaceae bacterium]|jgi:hypothetical protein|nr:hypothetical protein [Bifidobacteriaceae bacterium]
MPSNQPTIHLSPDTQATTWVPARRGRPGRTRRALLGLVAGSVALALALTGFILPAETSHAIERLEGSITVTPASPKPGETITITDTTPIPKGAVKVERKWSFEVYDQTKLPGDKTVQTKFDKPGVRRLALSVRAWDAAGEDRWFDSLDMRIVVRNPPHLTVYPLPGTANATANEVKVQVKAWGMSDWEELAGGTVQISTAKSSTTVTTDQKGVAEAIVPRNAGPVTARLTGSKDGSHNAFGTIEATNDLSKTGQPAKDVLFVADDNGPLDEAVTKNLGSLAQSLLAQGDSQIGLTAYSSSYTSYYEPHTLMPMTDSAKDFTAALATLDNRGGAGYAWDTIAYGLSSKTGFRPGADRCLVLISSSVIQKNTRPDGVTREAAVKLVRDSNTTVFGIFLTGDWRNDFQDLATDSGGAYFSFDDFAADPQPVLEALTNGCSATASNRPSLSISMNGGGADSNSHAPINESRPNAVSVTNKWVNPVTGVVTTSEIKGPATVSDISDGGTAEPIDGGVRVTWPKASLEGSGIIWYEFTWAPQAGAAIGDTVEITSYVQDDGKNGEELTPNDNSFKQSFTFSAARDKSKTGEPGQTTDSSTKPWWVFAIGLLAVIAVVGIVILLLTRRRKTKEDEPGLAETQQLTP